MPFLPFFFSGFLLVKQFPSTTFSLECVLETIISLYINIFLYSRIDDSPHHGKYPILYVIRLPLCNCNRKHNGGAVEDRYGLEQLHSNLSIYLSFHPSAGSNSIKHFFLWKNEFNLVNFLRKMCEWVSLSLDYKNLWWKFFIVHHFTVDMKEIWSFCGQRGLGTVYIWIYGQKTVNTEIGTTFVYVLFFSFWTFWYIEDKLCVYKFFKMKWWVFLTHYM